MYHIPPGPRGGGTSNRGGGGGRGAGRGGPGGGRGGGRGGSGGNRGGGGGGNRGNSFKRGGGGGRGGTRGGPRGGGPGKRGGGHGPGGNKSHPGSAAGSPNASASNLFSSLCTVCNDKPAKYRCITCRAPYCSLLCNNNHKKTPCTPTSYINASGNGGGMDEDDYNEQSGDKFEPKPMQSFLGALHRNVKSVPGLPSSVLIEEEERNARVPLSRLMRLVHTDAILDSLSSPALRDLISSIDSAPNDAIRENRLKHALAQPQFAQFADLCLEIIRKPDLSAPANPAAAAASAAAASAPDTSLAFAMDLAPGWQQNKWGMDVDMSDDDSDGEGSGDSDGDEEGAGSGDEKDHEGMNVDPETGGNAAEDGDNVAVEDGEEEGEIVLVG